MRTGNLGKLLSIDARGTFGRSGGFARVAFGYTYLGYYEWYAGIYSKKHGFKGPYISRMKFYRPTNPRSEIQQTWRNIFAYGVVHWQSLSDDEKKSYNLRGRKYRMTGFNYHQRDWLRLHRLPMIFTIKKSITSAEIKALHTTPIEMIPAPGAGKFIDLITSQFKLNYIAPAYSFTGGLLYLTQPSSSTAIHFAYNNVLTLTATTLTRSNYQASKLYENEPINLFASSLNPTSGNGTLDIYITYEIKDL